MFGLGGISFLFLLFGIHLTAGLFDSYGRKAAEEKIGDMLEELDKDFEVPNARESKKSYCHKPSASKS